MAVFCLFLALCGVLLMNKVSGLVCNDLIQGSDTHKLCKIFENISDLPWWWMNSTDACNWFYDGYFGIRCDLSGNIWYLRYDWPTNRGYPAKLSGQLDHSISWPPNMLRIYLSGNSFTGTWSDWSNMAPSTQVIYFDTNLFSGSIDTCTWTHMVNLSTVGIQYQSFSGSLDWDCLGSFTQLKHLLFRRNDFSGPYDLTKLSTTIEGLYLGQTNDWDPQPFPDLRLYTSLTYLNLQGSNVQDTWDNVVSNVPPNLQWLLLDSWGGQYNNITGYFHFEFLPQSIIGLYLSDNFDLTSLGDLDWQFFPPGISYVELDGCNLQGSVDLSIVHEDLQYLVLNRNSMSGEVDLSPLAGYTSNLQIWLYDNNFVGPVNFNYLPTTVDITIQLDEDVYCDSQTYCSHLSCNIPSPRTVFSCTGRAGCNNTCTCSTCSPSLTPTSRTEDPSQVPTMNPSDYPTLTPTQYPTKNPSQYPSVNPTKYPSQLPTVQPTNNPSNIPTINPTNFPSVDPTEYPSELPSLQPSNNPTNFPSIDPTKYPSDLPSLQPSNNPSDIPSFNPTNFPSVDPTKYPSQIPSIQPTKNPSLIPTINPTLNPVFTLSPSQNPSLQPTKQPIQSNQGDRTTQAPIITEVNITISVIVSDSRANATLNCTVLDSNNLGDDIRDITIDIESDAFVSIKCNSNTQSQIQITISVNYDTNLAVDAIQMSSDLTAGIDSTLLSDSITGVTSNDLLVSVDDIDITTDTIQNTDDPKNNNSTLFVNYNSTMGIALLIGILFILILACLAILFFYFRRKQKQKRINDNKYQLEMTNGTNTKTTFSFKGESNILDKTESNLNKIASESDLLDENNQNNNNNSVFIQGAVIPSSALKQTPGGNKQNIEEYFEEDNNNINDMYEGDGIIMKQTPQGPNIPTAGYTLNETTTQGNTIVSNTITNQQIEESPTPPKVPPIPQNIEKQISQDEKVLKDITPIHDPLYINENEEEDDQLYVQDGNNGNTLGYLI